MKTRRTGVPGGFGFSERDWLASMLRVLASVAVLATSPVLPLTADEDELSPPQPASGSRKTNSRTESRQPGSARNPAAFMAANAESFIIPPRPAVCLLYTSDAADE